MKHTFSGLGGKAGLAAVALIAGALACSTGSGGGGAATTEAPTQEQATEASGGGSPLDTLDPCTVLTQDDATAAFGMPAGQGQSNHYGFQGNCLYESADGKSHVSNYLVYEAGGGLTYPDFAGQKTADTVDVPGLGDGAYWDQKNSLHGAKGPWYFMLQLVQNGQNTTLDKLTPMAKAVLSRLP